MPNYNCLEGFCCPECGQEDEFKIAVEAWATVSDNGTEDFEDVAWDATSVCECAVCGFGGRVFLFDQSMAQKETVTLENIAGNEADLFESVCKIAALLHDNIHIEKVSFNDNNAIISARNCYIIAKPAENGGIALDVIGYDAKKLGPVARGIEKAAAEAGLTVTDKNKPGLSL